MRWKAKTGNEKIIIEGDEYLKKIEIVYLHKKNLKKIRNLKSLYINSRNSLRKIMILK